MSELRDEVYAVVVGEHVTEADLDSWVRLTDFEEGGDAAWFTNPDDEADTFVLDAEGDVLCHASSRAAAESIVAAMNLLSALLPTDSEHILQARGRLAEAPR